MKQTTIKKVLGILLTAALTFPAILPHSSAVLAAPEENSDNVSITIDNKEQFLEFVKNCQNDLYSLNKTFVLNTDIDLKGTTFKGIPYFCGSFNGNGHTISNITIAGSDSNSGLFRYISPLGYVYNLKAAGTIGKDSSSSQLGGIAGVNYGLISGCSFDGSLKGKEDIGGIAGINKAEARIIDCFSEAEISGARHTGGICGLNEGTVDSCRNESPVNIDEYQTTLNLSGVDLSTLNLTQNVVNRYDTGGIAGYSTGVIANCTNKAVIGYAHTGYNVGGIAGSQKGTITSCTNQGTIYGRKDVGGITGQAQPYMESEYLKDLYQQTQDQVKQLDETISGLSYSMNQTADSVTASINTLSAQYNDLLNSLHDNMQIINQSVSASRSTIQPNLDQITSAMNSIRGMNITDSVPTTEQVSELQSYLTVITDNLTLLTDNNTVSSEAVSTAVSSFSEEMSRQGQGIADSVNGIASSVSQGMTSLTSSMDRARSQVHNITETASNNLEYITTVDRIEDISSADARNLQGVLWGCINHGEILADLNAGGITGCMNIEYGIDPETDLDLTNSTNVTIRTTVNCVLAHCKNYGAVTSWKNTAGSIAGLEELGLIYNCEGYGNISSSEGDYAGGIAGNSMSSIEHCYSFANITGKGYTGGIAGYGYNLRDCISISSILCDGSCFGAIAGSVSSEGTISNNLFADNGLGGIDNISYVNRAWPCEAASLLTMDGIPESFHTVSLTFAISEPEQSVLQTVQVPYGGTISPKSIPVIPVRNGYYARWSVAIENTPVTENQTIEAEYVKWTTSVESNETLGLDKNGKAVSSNHKILAVGEFYEDTTLTLIPADTLPYAVDGKKASSIFEWTLKSAVEKEYDKIELHIPLPENYSNAQIYYQDTADSSKWTKAATDIDGSYLVCSVPYGSRIGVVLDSSSGLYIILAGAGCLIIILCILLFIRKKKRSPHVQSSPSR